jgi:hypothetical protein
MTITAHSKESRIASAAFGHILVFALGANKRPVHHIDNNGAWRIAALRFNALDQLNMFAGKVGAFLDKVEFGNAVSDFEVLQPERLGAISEAIFSFKGQVDNGSTCYRTTSVVSPNGNVQHRIKRPERFAAFRLPPYHDDAGARNDTLDEICRGLLPFDLVEPDQVEPIARPHVAELIAVVAATIGRRWRERTRWHRS